MLFGTQFTTEVHITQDGLRFSTNCNMFNSYPIQLTGTANQNSEWNGLPIEIIGHFLLSETNIPYLLQREIHQYISFTADQARLSKQNSLMSVQRARSQFRVANSTYQTRLQNYESICSEYTDAMTELENAIDEQTAAQQAVNANEAVLQATRNRIDNICEVQVCNDICVPGTVCEECMTTISSTVQGTCLVPCQRVEVVNMFYRVLIDFCFRYVENQLKCTYYCVCPELKICVAGQSCRLEPVYVQFQCYINVYLPTPVMYTGTCVEQCDTGITTTEAVEECCTLSSCSSLVANSTCTQLNAQCQMARDAAYAQLSSDEASLYEPLQRLDAARQQVSRARVNVVRLRSEKNVGEQLFNQSRAAYTSAQDSVRFAEEEYQAVRQQINQSLLLADILDETTEHIVQVDDVQFTVTVTTESPTTIPVMVSYSIPILGTTHAEEILLDFDYIDTSLRHRAIDLTNVAFDMTSQRRRRQVDDSINTGQRGIDEMGRFYGERCTDIKNVQEYMIEILQSLQTIANCLMENILTNNCQCV